MAKSVVADAMFLIVVTIQDLPVGLKSYLEWKTDYSNGKCAKQKADKSGQITFEKIVTPATLVGSSTFGGVETAMELSFVCSKKHHTRYIKGGLFSNLSAQADSNKDIPFARTQLNCAEKLAFFAKGLSMNNVVERYLFFHVAAEKFRIQVECECSLVRCQFGNDYFVARNGRLVASNEEECYSLVAKFLRKGLIGEEKKPGTDCSIDLSQILEEEIARDNEERREKETVVYYDDNGVLEKLTLNVDQSTENLAKRIESKMPPVAVDNEISEKERKEKEAVEKYLECVMKASQKLNAENPNHAIQTPVISKTKKKNLLMAKKKRVETKNAPPAPVAEHNSNNTHWDQNSKLINDLMQQQQQLKKAELQEKNFQLLNDLMEEDDKEQESLKLKLDSAEDFDQFGIMNIGMLMTLQDNRTKDCDLMTTYKVRDPLSFDLDPFQTDMFDPNALKPAAPEEEPGEDSEEKDDLEDLMKEFGLTSIDDEKNSHLIDVLTEIAVNDNDKSRMDMFNMLLETGLSTIRDNVRLQQADKDRAEQQFVFEEKIFLRDLRESILLAQKGANYDETEEDSEDDSAPPSPSSAPSGGSFANLLNDDPLPSRPRNPQGSANPHPPSNSNSYRPQPILNLQPAKPNSANPAPQMQRASSTSKQLPPKLMLSNPLRPVTPETAVPLQAHHQSLVMRPSANSQSGRVLPNSQPLQQPITSPRSVSYSNHNPNANTQQQAMMSPRQQPNANPHLQSQPLRPPPIQQPQNPSQQLNAPNPNNNPLSPRTVVVVRHDPQQPPNAQPIQQQLQSSHLSPSPLNSPMQSPRPNPNPNPNPNAGEPMLVRRISTQPTANGHGLQPSPRQTPNPNPNVVSRDQLNSQPIHIRKLSTQAVPSSNPNEHAMSPVSPRTISNAQSPPNQPVLIRKASTQLPQQQQLHQSQQPPLQQQPNPQLQVSDPDQPQRRPSVQLQIPHQGSIPSQSASPRPSPQSNQLGLTRAPSQQLGPAPQQQGQQPTGQPPVQLVRKPSTQQLSAPPQQAMSNPNQPMLVRKQSGQQLMSPNTQQGANRAFTSNQLHSSGEHAVSPRPSSPVQSQSPQLRQSNDIQQQRRVQLQQQQPVQQLQQQPQQAKFSIELVRGVVNSIHSNVVKLVDSNNIPSFNEIVSESKKLVFYRSKLQRLSTSTGLIDVDVLSIFLRLINESCVSLLQLYKEQFIENPTRPESVTAQLVILKNSVVSSVERFNNAFPSDNIL